MSGENDAGVEHIQSKSVSNRLEHKTQSTSPSESPPSIRATRSAALRESPVLHDEEPEQEALSMILSQIDEESYESALVYDAERILQRTVLPKSFLWNKPRIELLRTLPRDIEDMPGILHAGGVSLFQKSGINSGPLGFGMFDMGGFQRLDTKDNPTIVKFEHRPTLGTPSKKPLDSSRTDDDDDQREYPLKSYLNYRAAARRSDDSGIIELNVHLPPLPMDTALLTCQQHNILPRDPWLKHDKTSFKRAQMLLSAERMDTLATMPFFWEGVEKNVKPFIPEMEADPYTYEECLDTVGVMPTNKTDLYNATKRRQERKLRYTKSAQSSFRKWRLSVKVGGVSSRSALIKDVEANSTTPMYLNASFPNFVQTGKSVSIEAAQKLDEENGNYLGSYDCRASAPHASMSYQAMKSAKKNKNINIGRTRPIWSSFHQAGNNKIVCTSDLTGERLIADASKRPLQAIVYVRLNNEIISIAKTTKSSKYPKTTNFHQIIKWKDEDIAQGISEATKATNFKRTAISQNPNENSFCSFKTEEYLMQIAEQLKPPVAGKKRKPREFLPFRSSMIQMKYGATNILKYTQPKFNCLPLEDGFLRVVCEKSGSLQPCNVHDLFKAASVEENACSISWCNSDEIDLSTCVSCGLKVNLSCCQDKGGYLPSSGFWKCAVCIAAPTMIASESPTSLSSGGADEHQAPSRKSRRTSRLPTRFTENTEVDNKVIRKNSGTLANQDTDKSEPKIRRKRPSPSCSLCPHSGGAMSQLYGSNSNIWTHELCRIWCTRKKRDPMVEVARKTDGVKAEAALTPNKQAHSDDGLDHVGSTASKAGHICAICGMGDVSTHKDRGGLIKCAAQGCTVWFHPMCATLVTKLRDPSKSVEEPQSSSSSSSPSSRQNDDQIRKDIDLCNEFTLDLMEVRYKSIEEDKEVKKGDTLFIARGNAINSTPKKKIEKRIIPVGFCPLHNPKREKSFYGCTPGARLMSDFIKVPYQK